MTTSPGLERRADLDALRVGAVYLLFLFHTLKVYDPRLGYHVWSPDLIPGIQHVTAFITLWHMPLLFLLAGWSAILSLQSRGWSGFMQERVQRLALPLLFGCLLICPVIKYLELRSGVWLGLGGRRATAALQDSHGALQLEPVPVIEPYAEPFLTFLPQFYTSLKYFTWSHLWFIAYLLLLTVLLAPLLIRIASASVVPVKRPGLWLWLPAVALGVSEAALRPHWPGTQDLINDWANVARFAVYLGVGALWARHAEFGLEARRQWPVAVVAAAVLLGAQTLLQGRFTPQTATAGLLDHGLSAAAGWFCVIALLGLAARLITQARWWLSVLSKTAMPVYIAHQLFVVVAAFTLDRLPFPPALRLGVILAVSIAGTLLFVFVLVQRSETLKAGFGLRTSTAAAWRAAALAGVFATVSVVVLGGSG